MTNEEKANEIAQSVSFFWTNEDDYEKSIIDIVSLQKAIFNAALQAMQWKDEQFAKEKNEIDEQWKRLMAESKSIGVDILQRKDEVHAKEKQQWIDKACEWWTNNWRKYVMTDKDGIVALTFWKGDFKQSMKGE